MVHWTIAVPFLTCVTTAAVMVALQGHVNHPSFRATVSWIHRISGVCLITLPFLAVFRSKHDLRLHVYNVRQAWIWTLSDVKWLTMVGAAAVSRRVALPEQGKFNAAEKLNFMVLMGTYPLYIGTGLTIWLTHNAFLSWVVHVSVALMGLPLVLGHIYMATINPSSRVGLQGMISGFVDRQWARHHYRRWFDEHFEAPEPPDHPSPGMVAVTPSAWRRHGTHVLCTACGQDFGTAIPIPAGEAGGDVSLTCPRCDAPIHHLEPAPDPDRVEAALSGVAARGGATGMLSEALHRCEDDPHPPAASGSYIGFPDAGARPADPPIQTSRGEGSDAPA